MAPVVSCYKPPVAEQKIGFGLCADESEQFGNFGKHVFGDVAASRSRIGYQLLFVEFLRDVKRLFRREAVLGGGFFLERGQVVEQGSFLRLLLALGLSLIHISCYDEFVMRYGNLNAKQNVKLVMMDAGGRDLAFYHYILIEFYVF